MVKTFSSGKYQPGLYLRVPSKESREYILAKQITDIFDGKTPLYMFFTDENKLFLAPYNMRVDINNVMIRELQKRIGYDNVSIVKIE